MRAPLERAREVLIGDPGCVVADTCSADDRKARCFHTSLGVEVGAGGSLHQEVLVAVGLARSRDDTITLPMRWNPAGHEHLLPSFEGELDVSRDGPGSRVVLRGAYTVPLGLLGRFGDGVAGRRLAHRSLGAFVGKAARRLDAEVNRRHESIAWHPAPYPVAVYETPSENYIG